MTQWKLACAVALAMVACKKESNEKTTAGGAAAEHAAPSEPASAPAPAPAPAPSSDASSDPVKVVEQIFAAARTGKADALPGLCDPAGTGDGDVKDVCSAAPGSPKWDQFTKYFSTGTIDGPANVEGDRAAVSFLFGPGGTKKETMNLTKIDGKWYLASF